MGKAAAKESRKLKIRSGVSKSNIIDAALDANGDGRVTRSESRAAREAAARLKQKSTAMKTGARLRPVMKSAVVKKQPAPRRTAKAKPRGKVAAAAPTPPTLRPRL